MDRSLRRMIIAFLAVILLGAMVVLTIPIWYWHWVTFPAPGSHGKVKLHLRLPRTWRVMRTPGSIVGYVTPASFSKRQSAPAVEVGCAGPDISRSDWQNMMNGFRDVKTEGLSTVRGFQRMLYIHGRPVPGRLYVEEVVVNKRGDSYWYHVAYCGTDPDSTIRRVLLSFWVEPTSLRPPP